MVKQKIYRRPDFRELRDGVLHVHGKLSNTRNLRRFPAKQAMQYRKDLLRSRIYIQQ